MRSRTRYIGPNLTLASGRGVGRKGSLIRNRSRLAKLDTLVAHDYAPSIDHYAGQFSLGDSLSGGSPITISGTGTPFMSPLYGPAYVFLGGLPVLGQLDTVEPPDYTYVVFTAPSLDDYYTFLGLPTPSVPIGSSISVPVSIGNRYGMDSGSFVDGETFEWISI